MGRKRKNTTENRFKNYKICVICSTQNQMINYIPLSMKKFNFETIYNITIRGSEYFKNENWDKNLERVLDKKFINIELKQSDTHSVSKILENKEYQDLINLEDKIFWNITGGQRTILLAINKSIQEKRSKREDVICYLEGNSNKMYTSNIDYKNKDAKPINYDKEKFDLDITKALQLGGFKISEAKGEENPLDNTLLEKFIPLYEKIDNGLRELLIDTNKETTQQEALDNLKKLNIPNKDVVKSVIEWGYNKNSSTPFGYILEEMTRYQVEKLSSNIQEIKTNVRLYNEEKMEGINNTQIDEFDVLALTKNGKMIVFECKSGSMHPDIAKSTKYSTYAISGVYGLPILITPLLKSEIPPSSAFKNLGDKYDTIKASVASAKRAGLEVWGIDEIDKKLEKYIEL